MVKREFDMATTKKTVKKVSVKKSVSKKKAMPVETQSMATEMVPPTAKKMSLNPKFLTAALIILGIALLTYKFGPWLVPAVVNGKPVTRFEMWARMEKSYGAQTLDDLVNEKVLDYAIASSGVKVDPAKVEEQMKSLESQFESVGGLDEALVQRGLTRAELEKQVSTQLGVEEILKDKVTSTDEELQAEFAKNADTLYKDKKFEDVKEEVALALKDAKLRDAFLKWFAEVKESAKVKNFEL